MSCEHKRSGLDLIDLERKERKKIGGRLIDLN